MDINLTIKNIGKLTDANIRIGQFTVFAGPNNTGKSFVSKILYSLCSSVMEKNIDRYINRITAPLNSNLSYLKDLITKSEANRDISRVNSFVEIIDELVSQIQKIKDLEGSFGDLEELDNSIPGILMAVKNMQSVFSDVKSFLPKGYVTNDRLEDSERYLNRLGWAIDKDSTKFISLGIKDTIRENLIHTFQIQNITDLKGQKDMPSEITIEGFGTFLFSNESSELHHFDINSILFNLLYSDVIYIESPVYWKLKDALEILRIDPDYSEERREKIIGVPRYFYDLASTVKYKYTDKIAFPDLYTDLYKRLTCTSVLGGKITISGSGDLLFQEDGRSFPLSITAMGVANLGILALLIERKVLGKGSFLFIDEPEAHLHPAWQVIMAETLFELAKLGVNVVIATHSADILKWLEVRVKQNPDDENMIALNRFSANGLDSSAEDFEDQIAAIKQELTKPFADLYTAGL